MNRRNRIITRIAVPLGVVALGLLVLKLTWDSAARGDVLMSFPILLGAGLFVAVRVTSRSTRDAPPSKMIDDGSWRSRREEIPDQPVAASRPDD